MSLFDQWYRRHLGADPQEPASPPPFAINNRVVVSSEFEDAAFITGSHGKVVGVQFTTDPEDEYGPWVIRVLLDLDREPMKFAAHELTRETGPAELPAPMTIFVKQPEDTEPPAPTEDGCEPYTGTDLDAPVPYKPTRAADLESLKPWIQRAKELRHETMPIDSPVYDDVTASAMAADGLAAEVSAFLAEVAGGAA